MFANDLIARLDAMIAERNLLRHPFYQAWTAREIGIERLRDYAIKYYPHVDAFPRYITAIHSRCTNLATRQALLENLIEEERGAENHPELWLRFAEGLGVPREAVLDATPSAAAQNLVGTFVELTSHGPVVAGLAALYSYESQILEIAAAKIAGLTRFYGINDERALGFFAVHEKADRFHAETDAALIARHATTHEERLAAIDAADRALSELWSMLDSM